MKIVASTDGVGKSLEVRSEAHETRLDEARALSKLIVFLMEQLQTKI